MILDVARADGAELIPACQALNGSNLRKESISPRQG